MDFNPEQVLIKTPQGVNATRSGVGLSPRAYSMLKLFDGIMPISGFKQICLEMPMAEADFRTTLNELLQFDHLRVVANAEAAEAGATVAAETERRMLLTLDFTGLGDSVRRKSGIPGQPASSAAARATPPSALPRAATAQTAVPEQDSRDEKAVRLRREAEVRQKLVAALQPRVEEELRARLRPKLEQELRPKLIAALRPGVEAEVRTALIRELTPRVELELKARFAKTLAAQRTTGQQPVFAEAAPAAVVTDVSPAAGNSGAERLLASMSTPLFSLDKTGVCNYVSPAWAMFSGYATSDIVGKHLVDFFADADRRAIMSMLTGISNGTALRFEQQGALVRKGSEPLWVEINAAPLCSSSGESIGVCGVIRDAAESRRTADQAEADGVRLLLLVDQIDTGVILEDSAGNIQQANPALCTLLSLDAAPYSLEGMPVMELLERASGGFIGPEGFLRRVAEMRGSTEDLKGESFVMADGRVLEQDYVAVTVGNSTVGHLWLYREMLRPQARSAS